MYTSETRAKCTSNDIIARKQNFLAYSYVKSNSSDPNFLGHLTTFNPVGNGNIQLSVTKHIQL